MKKTKKEKQKEIKKKKSEEKDIQNRRIFKIIKSEEILEIRQFNKNTFKDATISKQELIQLLEKIFDIILRSSYIDKIRDMFTQNISDIWLQEINDDLNEVEINKEIIKNILNKELENLEECSEESIQLKICYWSNRMAHDIEDCAMGKKLKHKMNTIYIKYFLNPKCKFGVEDLLNYRDGKQDIEFNSWLDKILYNERESLEYSQSRDEIVDILLGIHLRNELFTTKKQMVRELLKTVPKSRQTDILLTCIPEEKEEVSIMGDKTIRLIIRERNAIAPVVMHTTQSNLEGIEPKEETNEDIMNFAKKGKIGIHFVMSEEELFALEYLADTKIKVQELSDMMYKGEEKDGER